MDYSTESVEIRVFEVPLSRSWHPVLLAGPGDTKAVINEGYMLLQSPSSNPHWQSMKISQRNL